MQEEQISNEKSALQFEVKENKLQSSKEKENRFHEKPSRSNRRSQKKTAPPTESGGSVSSVRENHSSKVPPPLQKRSKLKFEEPHSFKSNEEVRSSLKEEVPRLTDKEINKLGRLKYKKATAEEKYQKAKGKLPTKKKRSLQFETVSDGESKSHRLRFDKEEFMDTKKRSKILGKAKSEVTAQTKETFTKALDGGEREESTDETQVKGLLHTGKKVAIAPIKAPLQFKRFRDERHLKKFHQAEKKWVKAHVNFDMQSSKVQDRLSHTSKNSNPLSRAFQKRRLKKAYKEKLKAGSKKASKRLLKEVKKLLMLIKAPLLKIGMVCLVIVLILLVITSCSAVVTNMIQAMLTGTTFASYTADEGEIEQADWFFSELETDFESKIENAEKEHPNTDETLYFLNGNPSTKEELIAQMNHDPFALIAYLTVMYDDFIFEQIKPHIKQIFDELFVLDIRVDTEIRTRTAYDSDGIPFEENYEYNILMVNLTVNDFEEVATPYM